MQVETQEGTQAPGSSRIQKVSSRLESLGGRICPQPGQEANSMKVHMELGEVATGRPGLNARPLLSTERHYRAALSPFHPSHPVCQLTPAARSQAKAGQRYGDRLFVTYSLEQAGFILQQNHSWKDRDLGCSGSLSTLTKVESELGHFPVTLKGDAVGGSLCWRRRSLGQALGSTCRQQPR